MTCIFIQTRRAAPLPAHRKKEPMQIPSEHTPDPALPQAVNPDESVKDPTTETTEIEALAYRGEGIGHIQNKVIFVPFTAPGDSVEVLISENKRNYLRGTVEHFKTRSPHRIVPLCDYFSLCGGCHWQHLAYEYQLQAKNTILQETLARIGKIPPDAYGWLPPVPCSQPFGYRCKVRFQCVTRRHTLLGFYRAQSHDVIPVDRCELLPPFTNRILKKLREFLNSMDTFTRFTEIEILANPALEEATLSFCTPIPMGDEPTKDFLKALKLHIPQIYGVSIETVGEETSRIEHFGNCSLPFQHTFAPSSQEQPVVLEMHCRTYTFNQVNVEQNRNLMKLVFEWAEPSAQKKIVDLFCGMGNLSLPLAGRAGRIIGLENNPMAVEDARSNAERNGFTNCEFRQANVFSDAEEMPDLRGADVLIVDPPRKGAKECIALLAGLKPAKVLYVSCNPTTLARDASLFSYSGYRLNRLQMLDMFPQTYHIESIAEFVPKP